MRPLKEFGPELDKLLDSLKSNDKDDLRGSLRKAKAAARSVGIYSREKGSGSYHTIKAALDLAVAVWKRHPPGAATVAYRLAKAVRKAEKRRRKSGKKKK